jgi:hypothetical protein
MRTRLVRRRPEPRGASRGPDRGVSRSVTGPASWGLAERRGARAVGSGERHGACAVGLCGASRARAARSIARAGPSGRRKRPAGAWPWGCAEGRGARAVGARACPSGWAERRVGPGRGVARRVAGPELWGARACPSGWAERRAGAWPWGCAEGRGARAVGLGEALRGACSSGRSVARGPGRGAARSVRRAQPWGCRAIGSMTRSAPGRHWSGDPLCRYWVGAASGVAVPLPGAARGGGTGETSSSGALSAD